MKKRFIIWLIGLLCLCGVLANAGSTRAKDDAFAAEKGRVLDLIAKRDVTNADEACRQLLSRFSKHADLAQGIYEIACKYAEASDAERAVRLHEFNVLPAPKPVYGLKSQIEIVKTHINKQDDAAADAARDTLATVFAGEKKLPYEVYGLGLMYDRAKKPDRAGAFYRYVLDNWPQSPYAPWAELAILDSEKRPESDPAVQAALGGLILALPQQELDAQDIYKAAQDVTKSRSQRALALHLYNADYSPKDDQYTVWSNIEVVKAHIRGGSDTAATAAFNMMLTRYATLETMPDIVYLFGDIYIEVAKYDKAEQMYQYVESHWPTPKDTLWAQVGRARSCVAQGDETQAEAIFQKMMTDYASHPRLVEGVRIMGESYWDYVMRALRNSQVSEGPARGHGQPNWALAEKLRHYQAMSLGKFEMVIAGFPEDSTSTPLAYHIAGNCCSALGQRQKAAEYYQKLCRTWPQYKMAWHVNSMLGQLCERMAESRELSRSEADAMIKTAYERLIEFYPASAAAPAARSWLAGYSARIARLTRSKGELK